ncbi:helix-turn-helix domain-containing protein [Halocatena salina]|uniref:Helix-turn-helix domain-containing protein n=1 Tax=Halocatena salina TaxID=2934340 RepID=A0A8U0A6G7_9EURY|nr:helix-turn-helix domain-containing protein [Halocatena salina]UPM44466.1 helix-turn-helix domain-containing protein [Halocatena salina]
MPDAIHKQLQDERECEGLLACMLGLNKLDKGVFRLLATHPEPLTVDQIAKFIDRERTTAYRSVRRLQEAGVAVQDQENCPKGGYHYVYRVADPDEIADELQRMLNEWYANTGQLIQEFRDTYGKDRSPETNP